MFCPKCGNPVVEDDNFCRKCATRLSEVGRRGTIIEGNVTTSGGDFIGRDLKKKLSMVLNPRGGCINITIIQASVFLIAIFFGTMAYQTPEIHAYTRRLITNILRKIETENIPRIPITLPTPILIFTPTRVPTPIPCSASKPIGWEPYLVTEGKRLTDIAAEMGVTIEKLIEVNCLQGMGGTIPAGMVMLLGPKPISQVKENLIARVDASPILNMYNQEAVQFINNLFGRLNEFQLDSLGITKNTMLSALMRTDAGDRINAIVNEVWQDWLNLARENGVDANTTVPSNIGVALSPFRKLIIRMIQGSKVILTDSEQHALYNYFSRDEAQSVWANDISIIIGAVNRESFLWP